MLGRGVKLCNLGPTGKKWKVKFSSPILTICAAHIWGKKPWFSLCTVKLISFLIEWDNRNCEHTVQHNKCWHTNCFSLEGQCFTVYQWKKTKLGARIMNENFKPSWKYGRFFSSHLKKFMHLIMSENTAFNASFCKAVLHTNSFF